MQCKFRLLALVLTLALLLLAVGATTVQATVGPDVPPVFVDGNPTCQDLGFAFGYKIDSPNSGTYDLWASGPSVTVATDGVYFDWTSMIGIDAVIAKGGPNANLYKYDPPAESYGDDGLHSPINPNTNEPFGLSHIEFCYDINLEATKTANATYTRTFTWGIEKSVTPESHSGFPGDTFSSDYDVIVDQTVNDTDFAVSGEIKIHNPAGFEVNFSVVDSVGGVPAAVNCPSFTVPAGGDVTCTYTASLGSKTDGTNTATITSNTAGVGGTTASANYAFGDPTTVVGYPTVNVTDSVQGDLGSTSGDYTFEYSDGFDCPTDPDMYTDGVYETDYPNVATIDETGQSDNANVHLTCYAPIVTKDAAASFTRTWTWTIDKVGSATDLTLSVGQQHLVEYDVTVSATSEDSAFAVSGKIYVENPGDESMTVDVTDVLNDAAATAATVDCGGGSTSLTVAAGGTGSCNYTAAPADDSATENTATATINGVEFSGTAPVAFVMDEVDECINVTDTKQGDLGTVCATSSPFSFVFEYSRYVGPYAECGEYTDENTASFETNDTGATGSDSHTVDITVPCAGCTLTQGYWKTHSDRGPAPYDDAWKNIGPLEEDTIFFSSGQTWYQVFWTAPAGNAYYNLAHQYMAAKLNILNGASTTPEVDAAMDYAKTFFETYSPSSTISKSLRAKVLAAASTLDQFNNGLIGPGHCSEDARSASFAGVLLGPGLYLPAITK